MHDYLWDAELARLAVVLGVIIGLLIYQRTGLTFGGVIVPGYLASFMTRPTHIAATLLCGILTNLFINKVILKRRILYGRQLFETEILVAVIFQSIWTGVMTLLGQMTPELLLFTGVGFVVPGVIAHDIRRQGVKRTVFSSLLGAVTVFLVVELVAGLRDILPNFDAMIPSPLTRSQPYGYSFPIDWLPIAIVFGIVASMFVFKKFKVRPSGFVISAYLAILVARPLTLVFVLAAAIVTYLLVTRGVARVGMIFGRAKLGSMVLVGVVVAWGMEIAAQYLSGGTFLLWSGFKSIMPMIVALIANEFERQGPLPTLTATSISTGLTLAGMWGLMLLVNFLRPL
jgi:poly-gamma-glutamate biosynthesis protein PgsC/CapC